MVSLPIPPPDMVDQRSANGVVVNICKRQLKFQRLSPHAVLPRYAHEGDAGLDLSAAIDTEIIIPAGSRLRIPTGWAVEIPIGLEGQVRGRSSMNAKGLLVPLGTIDAGYRGEISVVLLNLSGEPKWIHPSDRIAQLEVVATFVGGEASHGELTPR